MILRIVKMKFNEEGQKVFPEIYFRTKPFILQCEGCYSVELLKDNKDPTTISTMSIWKDEESLNNYRNTELFNETWKKVKTYFKDKPQANSYIYLDKN